MDFEKPVFFNTTELKGVELVEARATALTQEEIVYSVFYSTGKSLSWSEVAAFLPDMNEVSLKRSLTVLTIKGRLVKTSDSVLSKYGKKSYRYQLIKK